jgi:predicted nuclease with TOPRIM domain
MPKLYEIADQYAKLMQMLAENDGEITEAEQTVLKDLQGELIVKGENIARLIKNLQSDVSAFKGEGKRLLDRAKSLNNRIEWLKDYLKFEMTRMGVKDIKGEVLTVRVRDSQPSCMIINETDIPEDYKEIVQETKIDRRGIIDHWKEKGELVPGAEIAVGQTLTIR